MPEFLLEVGCEELPASFVEKAYTDLAGSLSKELEALGIKNSEPVCMGTPRRLIVSFPELKPRQEDSTKEQRGPSLSAAYGPDGNPTGALLGFCKSQGITPNDLRKDEQYVWVTKHIPGQDTNEVLAKILPGIILGLNFDKSMRWGSSKVRFARPIRWIVAAFDGKPVNFDVEDVPSSLLSHGHRFYAPALFEARTLEELKSKLKDHFVEPEVEKRKERILAETHAIAKGTPEITDDLLDENAFLCEWPTAIRGTFPESYLELPEPVLVTAMAKHERMFPIRDGQGKLTNAFVFIRNSGENETVQRGCEWVLGARFNDARFFYEQDQKHNLDYFLEKTNDILFQAQLGTVRQRADRLAGLASNIAMPMPWRTDHPDEYGRVLNATSKAGLYSKADLSTGLVSELSSLQGVIGAEYARKEGMSEEVAIALELQYKTPTSPMKTAGEKTAGLLIIADQIDKLAGYLGLGLEPSGSSDPFGLRKSVTTLIRVSQNWDGTLASYSEYLEWALIRYKGQGVELDPAKARPALATIFEGRYLALFDNFSYDVIRAASLSENLQEVTNPRRVMERLTLMSQFKSNSNFVQAASRPINIVEAAEKKGIEIVSWSEVDSFKLDSLDGQELYKLLKSSNEVEELFVASKLKEYLLSLAEPINAFFDKTMIMATDENLRAHRLGLAKAVAQQLLVAGDFTKLEG